MIHNTSICGVIDLFSIPATITVNGPVASITAQTNVLCFGNLTGSATVTATGGTAPYSYSWSPSGGTAATANGLAAGVYTVTVTDANACTTSAIATITQPEAALTATASAYNLICNEGTTKLKVTANGGTQSYQYSLDNINYQTSNEFTVYGGTYAIYIKDANGCTYIIPSYTIQNACLTVAKTVDQASISAPGTLTYSHNNDNPGTQANDFQDGHSAHIQQGR